MNPATPADPQEETEARQDEETAVSVQKTHEHSFGQPGESLPSPDRESLGLYVHFPYCLQRCTYCDFNAHLAPEDRPEADVAYQQALSRDIQLQSPSRLRSVFWGGGTPSLMPAGMIRALTEELMAKFDWPSGIECTIEVNPGTADQERFSLYGELGINRISIGAQSFEPAHLQAVGRFHRPDEIEDTFRAARRAGHDNVSMDLIYGFPEQSLAQWDQTLERALALDPDHLSVYHLTVEPSTHLEHQLARGEVELPCEETRAEMDDLAIDRLTRAGFERYELSNWCRPGKHCRHNLNTWRDRPYLGLGCGAVSYLNGWRIHRLKAPLLYQRALLKGRSPVSFAERPGLDGALKDFLMVGLRTREGVTVSQVVERFPRLDPQELERFFQRLPRHWWDRQQDRYFLTRAGWDFHSEVTVELLSVLFSFL